MTTPANALPAYLTTATMSRSATEAAGPALLVVSIATIGNATTGSYIVASLTASAAIGGPVVGALIDRARSPRRGFALAMAIMATGLAAIALDDRARARPARHGTAPSSPASATPR